MDRQIIYAGQIPLDVDQLKESRNVMVGVAALAAATLGSATAVDGLACTPTSPASLEVNVAPGSIYEVENLDDTAYGSLIADTDHQIVKQGIVLDTTLLNCPAPVTAGFSVNYLVQVALEEVDTDPVVLAYYNADDPATPFAGPGNDGFPDNTRRACQAIVTIKAGIAATTGSQATPAPDANNTGLWVVTVANGQTTITLANIAKLASAPFIPVKLPALPNAIQQSAWVYAEDVGSANLYGVIPSPQLQSLGRGTRVVMRSASMNTAASTLTVAGFSAKSITYPGGQPLSGGEITVGMICVFYYDGSHFQMISPVAIPTLQAIRITTDRDLALSDVGRMLFHGDESSPARVTLKKVVDIGWSPGARISFQNRRSGAVLKVTPVSGVSLYWGNSNVGERTFGDTGRMTITMMEADEWYVSDDYGLT